MRDERISTLQWATGAFGFFTGVLMLIVPEQFRDPSYAALQPQLSAWGVLFATTGVALIRVAAGAPRRGALLAAHLLAGGAFLLLAWGFLTADVWRATAAYGTLGLAVLLAPLLPRTAPRSGAPPPARPDLFPVTIGAVQIAVGTVLALLPEQLAPDLAAVHLGYAAAMLLAGAALLASQLVPSFPPRAAVAAHLLSGGVLVAWMLASSWPRQAGTGILFYGGFGLFTLLTPWLGPRLRRSRPDALRTQLALAFAAVAALPLVLLTGVLVTQATRGLSEQVREDHRLLAVAVAHGVAEYIELHRAAAAVIAEQPGLFELGEDAQRDLVRPFFDAYSEFTSLDLYDPEGGGLLRSDGGPIFPVAGRRWFEEVRATRRPVLDVDVSQALGRPLFYIAYPALAPDGSLQGVVAATLESSRLAELLARSGVTEQVYLVDETGRLLVHSAGRVETLEDDLSAHPPVAELLRRGEGSLAYEAETELRLAGYAGVPELGWGVVVERPRDVALGALLRWRGASFGLLLVVIAGAVAIGTVLARRLAAPLGRLATAADALAAGDETVPLPQGPTFELAQLAASFGRMRDRLTERTTELQRERDFSEELNASLEARVRERTAALENANRELEAANRELEAFMYSVSHDLRAPLRGIDGFAHALEEDEGARLGPAAREYLQRIRAGAGRMGHLIDDLLHLSRLQRSPLHRRTVDLSAMAAEVAEDLRGGEPDRSVAVAVRPDLAAVGDPGLLRIVLENLLANAWKFTRERPRARIEVGSECRDGVETFFVRDDGAGFDPAYADKLFTPFQRLHRRDEFDGNGIGLATVQRIVHRHGGRIWGEGEVGRGATFYFTLPRRD